MFFFINFLLRIHTGDLFIIPLCISYHMQDINQNVKQVMSFRAIFILAVLKQTSAMRPQIWRYTKFQMKVPLLLEETKFFSKRMCGEVRHPTCSTHWARFIQIWLKIDRQTQGYSIYNISTVLSGIKTSRELEKVQFTYLNSHKCDTSRFCTVAISLQTGITRSRARLTSRN